MFTAEFDSERILKIGQHLPKLWAIKYRVVFFNETQCMGLSRTVSEIDGDFSWESQKNSHPLIFCAPAEGVPLAPGVKNKNDEATGPRKKFDDIFSLLDTIHQRDRQTDGQTPGDSKDRAYA